MKVSRCSAISFVSACLIHVSQSKKKKKLIPLVSLVKRPTLSHLCNMVTICNVFRLLWSHIVVTAVDLCWQPSLLCPTFFFLFFFIKRHISSHYIISEITLMCWGKNTPGILCAVMLIHTMHFFLHLLPFGPKRRYYFIIAVSVRAQTTHLYSRTTSARALLAFMAVSLLAANRGQWGDRLGISDHR